MIAVTVKTT